LLAVASSLVIATFFDARPMDEFEGDTLVLDTGDEDVEDEAEP